MGVQERIPTKGNKKESRKENPKEKEKGSTKEKEEEKESRRESPRGRKKEKGTGIGLVGPPRLGGLAEKAKI